MIAVLEQIKPETAEQIASNAHEQGLPIDDYLKLLLAREAIAPKITEEKVELTPAEKARLWVEWVDKTAVRGVVIDDSRESIYTREDEAL